MEITEKIDYNDLTNKKTKPLYTELASKYSFEILRVIQPEIDSNNWFCNINCDEVQIKTYDKNNTVEYFTHELLHIYLDMNGFVESKIVFKNLVYGKGNIQYILGTNEIGHINNTLAHTKMLPLFLDYGFEISSFTSDFNKKLETEQIINHVRSELPKREIPNSGIKTFICQYFSMRFLINKNFEKEYIACLNRLGKLDRNLFQICEKIANKWEKTIDWYINYKLIDELVNDIENWLEAKKNHS